jgi:translation initiation factor IF-3
MKQVRFSCLSEEHDIATKVDRTVRFLAAGHPVRVAAVFKK